MYDEVSGFTNVASQTVASWDGMDTITLGWQVSLDDEVSGFTNVASHTWLHWCGFTIVASWDGYQ